MGLAATGCRLSCRCGAGWGLPLPYKPAQPAQAAQPAPRLEPVAPVPPMRPVHPGGYAPTVAYRFRPGTAGALAATGLVRQEPHDDRHDHDAPARMHTAGQVERSSSIAGVSIARCVKCGAVELRIEATR